MEIRSAFICILMVYTIIWIHPGALVEGSRRGEGLVVMVAEAVDEADKFCVRYKDNSSQTCVFIQNTNKATTWDEAREICENWGGRLPETENREEAETIDIIVKKRFGSMWLGATMFTNVEGDPQGDLEASSSEPEGGEGSGGQHGNRPGARHGRGPFCGGPPGTPNSHVCDHILCGVYKHNAQEVNSFQYHNRASCYRHLNYVCVAKKDNHTGTCPTGFRSCLPKAKCYKLADDEVNWFRANENCEEEGARLPDVLVDSELSEVMKCLYEDYYIKHQDTLDMGRGDGQGNGFPGECPFFWSSQHNTVWTWESTEQEMGRTLWDTKQPECPLLDCVKIGANGLWSVANCDERTNFTCIKVDADCADCQIIIYGDSSKEVIDDESDEIRAPVKAPVSRVMMIGMIVLAIIVITVVIALIVVSYKIRKDKIERRKERCEQQRYMESFYEHLARRDSTYENDSPEFNIYNTLDLNPGNSIYTTIEPEGIYGDQAQATNEVDAHFLNSKNFKPRKGSLPATPDLIPVGQQMKMRDAEYLEVFPCPYKDYKKLFKLKKESDKDKMEDLEERCSLDSNENAYADRQPPKEGHDDLNDKDDKLSSERSASQDNSDLSPTEKSTTSASAKADFPSGKNIASKAENLYSKKEVPVIKVDQDVNEPGVIKDTAKINKGSKNDRPVGITADKSSDNKTEVDSSKGDDNEVVDYTRL